MRRKRIGFAAAAVACAAFAAWVDRDAAFMHAAASRYRGKFKRWELWNEENLHWNWKPAPSAAQYARWYTAVYGAVVRL